MKPKYIDNEVTPISIDLETLSLDPRAAVIDIGAVNMATEDFFSIQIAPAQYTKHDNQGFVVDSATIQWHNEQHSWYLGQCDQSPFTPVEAIIALVQWLRNQDEEKRLRLWMRGKDADYPWLCNMAKACQVTFPIPYYHVHCQRDITKLYSEYPKHKGGAKHTAYQDAINQMDHLLAIAADQPRVSQMLWHGKGGI